MSTDNQSPENNPYYFYQLTSSQDLLPETFQRRVSKSTQAQNKGFLFCLFSSDQFFKNYCDFIGQQSRPCDALMVPWSLFQEHKIVLQKLVEKKSLSVFYIVTTTNEFSDAEPDLNQPRRYVVMQAKTRKEALLLLDRTEKVSEEIRQKVSFLPRQFNQNSGPKVSAVDYLDLLKSKKLTNLSRNFQIPFWNEGVDQSYELEPLVDLSWSISAAARRTDLITVSVIIPTFNNSRFLVNVLTHLADQQAVPESYEVIIVDDGSEDSSSEIIKKFLQSHKLDINLRYLYWSKKDLGRGPQNFFRPGQARNLAAKYAIGEYLMFLDSDMLVPPTFINECQQALNNNDLIQFQRFHIKQTLSLTNPRWKDVDINKDCYIEEKHYWSQLFNCEDWNKLPHKWKFVCTYALGIRREEFFKIGRFKRHFISYGFEDTDLGFRMYKQNKKFKLIKTPLLHLTNYSQMQYQNSAFKRHELLSVTAKLFFLDHLDFEIGSTLRTFLGGEKGLIDRFKDRFLDN